MPFLIKDVMIGGVSSLLTVFIILVAKSYVIPKVLGFLQRAPQITGVWEILEFNPTGNPKLGSKIGLLTIKQLGVRIKATVLLFDKNREFKYAGHFYSGQLVMTFEEKHKEGYNVGAFVLKYSPDGNEMEGSTLFWHNKKNDMVCNKYKVKKNSKLNV